MIRFLMKRLAILLSLLWACNPAFAATPHVSAFQWQAGITNAFFHLNTLPYVDTVQLNTSWFTLDPGATSPAISYTAWEALSVASGGGIAELNGYPLVNCTTAAGTTTCTDTGATMPFNTAQHIYLKGVTGGSPNCADGDYTLTAVSATAVQFPSSCTGTGGKVMDSCGTGIAGQTGQPCNVLMAVGSNINDGAQRNPPYIGTQAYANAIAPAWTANTNYGFHAIVTNGGHFYHNVTLGANGYCPEGASFGSVCSWTDDGTSNAFVQEFSVGTGYTGGANDPVIGNWISGGATFSVNTSNCGAGGVTGCVIGDTVVAYPHPWETPYITAFSNFCSSNGGFLQHYHALLGSQLLAAMCGAPHGVEWFGDLTTYFTGAAYGMSLTQWEGLFLNYSSNAIWTTIHNEWVSLGSPVWGMVVADGIYQGCATDLICSRHSDLIAQASITAGFPENSPGYFGLRIVDLTNYAAGILIRGDWVCISQGNLCVVGGTIPSKKAKFYMLEPLGVSLPPGTAGGSATQITTGSMTQILPFATQRIPAPGSAATLIFAAFGDDLTCAYAPIGFVVTVSGGNYPACPNTQYQAPFANLAAGVPNSTSSIQGTAKISGNAVIQ